MIPLPFSIDRGAPPSDHEVMAHARKMRRQRRRWHRAWCREGMPGYWEDYEMRRRLERW